jgi:hypothetical protein
MFGGKCERVVLVLSQGKGPTFNIQRKAFPLRDEILWCQIAPFLL